MSIYTHPTGGIIFTDEDGFQANSEFCTFNLSSQTLFLEGGLDIKSTGATGNLQTDTLGRLYVTPTGFATESINIGSDLFATGAYGGYQIYATASNTMLAARQNTVSGLSGPEYQLSPTVLVPTNFYGTTGATAIAIGTGTTPGTLIQSVGLTPSVTGYSYITTTMTLENPSNDDTIVSIYATINGTTGYPTQVFLLKKQGTNSTYSNVSVQQRTIGTNPAHVLLTGSVYAYQTVANAAQLTHIDMMAFANLA